MFTSLVVLCRSVFISCYLSAYLISKVGGCSITWIQKQTALINYVFRTLVYHFPLYYYRELKSDSEQKICALGFEIISYNESAETTVGLKELINSIAIV